MPLSAGANTTHLHDAGDGGHLRHDEPKRHYPTTIQKHSETKEHKTRENIEGSVKPAWRRRVK